MKQITMPRLSDTMEEGAISTWNKKVGDKVEPGDVLVEIETDKANMDFEAYESGTLTKILVPEGQTVAIGTPIAELDGEPAGSGDDDAAPAAGAEPGTAAEPEAGAAASAGSETATAEETTPADAETPTQAPAQAAAPEADSADTAASTDTADQAASPAPVGANSRERLLASPVVRTIAREHGIDLHNVTGTGPGGRIIRADVEKLIGANAPAANAAASDASASSAARAAAPAAQPAPAAAAASAGQAAPAGGAGGAPAQGGASASLDERRGTEQVPMDSVRRVIARRLAESAQTIPHFAVTAAADAEELMTMRATLNERLVAAGRPKVSVNDLLVRAAALALREHPLVNASYPSGDSTSMQVHHRINIGIAVASDHGLVVPVIDDADTKSVGRLAEEAKSLVKLAQDRKLTPAQMSGGTFTISNLGMYGVESFTAIINPPEGAILAVGGTKAEPAVVNGEVVPRRIMRYTLNSDHRIIDGALAAQWMQTFTKLIEDPWTILA
ncbi:dihydrolipoamide acetyltransferase family protein [Humibacter albus]|uniref:dihydrolipoamide acetyltransferase family protein n=1 Tax=Humibacter albus TaxID=427754 RepID=UPI0003B3AEDC|nr:dihydrolipoamide acetyltransferase family protein [Humibacter albus]